MIEKAEWMNTLQFGRPLALGTKKCQVTPQLLFINRKCGKVNATKVIKDLKDKAKVSGELATTNVQKTVVTKVCTFNFKTFQLELEL